MWFVFSSIFLALYYVQSSDLCTQMKPRPLKIPKTRKRTGEEPENTKDIWKWILQTFVSISKLSERQHWYKTTKKNPYTLCQIEGESDITNTCSAFDLVQQENYPKCRDLNLWVVDALMEKYHFTPNRLKSCTNQWETVHITSNHRRVTSGRLNYIYKIKPTSTQNYTF